MSTIVSIFVYGTLKPGEINHHICESFVLASKDAIAQGQIYHLPLKYPAMTVEEPGEVRGVLLTCNDTRILAILDQFEQHDPILFAQVAPHHALAAHQYRRALIPVVTCDRARSELAWSYVMTTEQIRGLNGKPIPNGCWDGSLNNCAPG